MNLKTVKCNICNIENTELIFKSTIEDSKASVTDYVGTNPGYAKYHDIVRCKNCRLVYMNPRDNHIPELLSEVEDTDYISTWNDRLSTFKVHLDLLKQFKSGGKLLDVGCYAGIFLTAAKEVGFSVSGLEPSKWAAGFAADKAQVPVVCRPIEAYEMPVSEFDIVTLWDVIEHLEDPMGTLSKIQTTLKPGGLVFISTHNIESIFARALGKRYPWLMRFHLFHFSPNTLKIMAEKAGLKTVRVESYKKVLPLSYFLKRAGLDLKIKFFDKIKFSIDTKDMFVLVAQKV